MKLSARRGTTALFLVMTSVVAPAATYTLETDSEFSATPATATRAGDLLMPYLDGNPALAVRDAVLPPLDINRAFAEDAAGPAGALRVGVNADFVFDASTTGRLWQLPDGRFACSTVIAGDGAVGVRLRVGALELPAGMELYVHGREDSSGAFPVMRAGWLPTIWEDDVVLTVVGDDAAFSGMPTVLVDGVSQMYRDARNNRAAECPRQHLDVTCYSDFTILSRAVALYDFTTSGGTFICTGSLLADADTSSQVPWFYTANHCISDTASADSTEFYWFYQTSSCNGSAPSINSSTRSFGARLIKTRQSADGTLLRLDQPAPPTAAFLGWTATLASEGSDAAVVQHPSGDYKRIAFANIDDNSYSIEGRDCYLVTYTNGTTEGGSSGSPLINDNGRVIGSLFGGEQCNNSPSQHISDYYGRFVKFYDAIDEFIGTTGGSPDQVIDGSGTANSITYAFDGSGDGWTFDSGAGSGFAPATGSASGGSFNLTTSANTNSFAFIASPAISVVAGSGAAARATSIIRGRTGSASLYRARVTVASNAASQAVVPNFRIRTSSADFQQSDSLVISSIGDGSTSPVAAKTYDHFFALPAGVTTAGAFFDVLNFDGVDAANATLSVQQFQIEHLGIERLGSGRVDASWDFTGSQTRGFTARTASPLGAPIFAADAKGLSIKGSTLTQPTNVIFGFYGLESSIAFDSSRIYVLEGIMETNLNSSSIDNLPAVRFRLNDSSFKTSAVMNIESPSDSSRIPGVGSFEYYDTFFAPPAEINGQTAILSFDYLFVPGTANNATSIAYLRKLSLFSFPKP